MNLPARITFEEYARLKADWFALSQSDTFDLPADHPAYARKVQAHLAFLHAQAAYTGIDNTAVIVLIYGKETQHVRISQEQTNVASDVDVESLEREASARHTPASDMAAVGRDQAEAGAQSEETADAPSGEALEKSARAEHFSLTPHDNRPRCAGVITFWNGTWGYASHEGTTDVYLAQTDILGLPPFALQKGDRLTYNAVEGRTRLLATCVCLEGNEESEREYRTWLSANADFRAQETRDREAARALRALRKAQYDAKLAEITRGADDAAQRRQEALKQKQDHETARRDYGRSILGNQG